jgi:hypothetical protein
MNVRYIDIDIGVSAGEDIDANVLFCKICVSYNALSYVYHTDEYQ